MSAFQPDLGLDLPHPRPAGLPPLIDHRLPPRDGRRVELRRLLPNEAHHFTPLMASDLRPISRALGLRPLHVHGCRPEFNCGGKWLDILAVDRSRRVRIAIENQYGWSNDDHVDRLNYYASYVDAEMRVLVCERIDARHRHLATQDPTFVFVRVGLYESRRGWGIHYDRLVTGSRRDRTMTSIAARRDT